MDRARKHRGVDRQDGSEAMPVVHIEPVDEEARQLWDAAIALADELPARGWALVGGLMVQLHAHRHDKREFG